MNVLEWALQVPEINKIIQFSEHLLKRQTDLLEEYNNTFVHIYKDRLLQLVKRELDVEME